MLDEEVDRIVDFGVEARFGHEIKSLKAVLDEGFDAVFVGTGAPKGKDLDIPGRKEAAANIHIGIDWLTSVAFAHVEKVGKRVVVIGGGNTAMDCCRTARAARRREGDRHRAQPAQGDEGVGLGDQGRAPRGHPDPRQSRPKAFVIERGKLAGVLFEKMREMGVDAKGRPKLERSGEEIVIRMRRRADGDRPGERVPLDRARHRHRIRRMGHAEGRPQDDSCRRGRACSSAATRRGVRRTSSGRWRTVTRRRSRSIMLLPGRGLSTGPQPGSTLVSQKMGIHEWSYSNDYDPPTIACRCRMRSSRRRSGTSRWRSSSATTTNSRPRKPSAASTAMCRRCSRDSLCIECDACMDICPVDCINFTENDDEAELAARLRVPALNPTQDLYVSDVLQDRAHHGEGRGRVPALRPVRRALSDGRMGHAEIRVRGGAGGSGLPRTPQCLIR